MEDDFLIEHDKDGNVIRIQHNSKRFELLSELNAETGELEERKKEYDEDKEPVWTEVRGGASFYYICPRCGAFIPGTGPKIMGSDGVERLPKDQHEHWHKTFLCDWYID